MCEKDHDMGPDDIMYKLPCPAETGQTSDFPKPKASIESDCTTQIRGLDCGSGNADVEAAGRAQARVIWKTFLV